MSREKQKNIAEHTLKMLEQGAYTNAAGECILLETAQRHAENGTRLYRPEDAQMILAQKFAQQERATIFELSEETTLDAARRLMLEENIENLVLLNFASAKNAGGGFLGGSQAQEESIARASGLYPCLLRAPDYYAANRAERSMLYTDHIIYSPLVPVFKDELGNAMDTPIFPSIITAPAANKGAMRQHQQALDTIEGVMLRRIELVLRIALMQGQDTIILGAWGCGVFQNDPQEIARYFAQVLREKLPNQFRRVIFAVYSSKKENANLRAFKQYF